MNGPIATVCLYFSLARSYDTNANLQYIYTLNAKSTLYRNIQPQTLYLFSPGSTFIPSPFHSAFHSAGAITVVCCCAPLLLLLAW